MNTEGATGWIARFTDGPLLTQGDRNFSVEEPWDELVLAPFDEPHTWVVVGGSGLPPIEEPWPDQLVYRRIDGIEAAGPDGEPVAYYELDQ